MAFDEKLADRVRRHVGKRSGLSEKKMFGGLDSARRTSDFASSAAMRRRRGHGVPICQVLLHL